MDAMKERAEDGRRRCKGALRSVAPRWWMKTRRFAPAATTSHAGRLGKSIWKHRASLEASAFSSVVLVI